MCAIEHGGTQRNASTYTRSFVYFDIFPLFFKKQFMIKAVLALTRCSTHSAPLHSTSTDRCPRASVRLVWDDVRSMPVPHVLFRHEQGNEVDSYIYAGSYF